ncbi:MAG: c-type cytochrome [Alphaproteobacteria bacterium]|nr:c-type cytochrome [Alphaproteobacteria bacterium]
MDRANRFLAAMVAIAAAPLAGAPAFAQADLASGQKLFQQRCAVCHSLKAVEKKPTGPDLENIVGRKAGASDFGYSADMKGAAIVWDEKKLDEYLAAPAKLVPGTTMPIGVPQAADREDIVAYLKSISK